ncbi:hypothetical protein TNCV_5077921 [Trichonephila clavipes]|uniref:Uncharacterized protein n=1 Tax=Trichonephila clavipes TaxID=2585209 RepID=A0A8X6S3G5_TRICX|nr:hypothetical protein TNCV_5077921 [Trichonephila clavipes]
MDACKCIMPSRHGDTLNSRGATSPLVRLVEGEERWLALTSTSLKIGVEPSKIALSPVWCLKLRLMTGEQLSPCHDEFRGP